MLNLIERLICRVPMWYRALFPGARWRIPGIKSNAIFLTFDDGPIPEVTPWVLDKLDELEVKATFFCVADNVRKYPELFEEIKKRGHAVGNHTYHHVQGLKMRSRDYIKDILEADKLIGSRYFRPPYGHMRFPQVLKIGGMFDIIMWDIITRDYNSHLSPEAVLAPVIRYARNGSIVVFHDSIKSERNMKEAMPHAVEWLKNEGYTFYRIGEIPR